jgi:hypothetical protein
MPAASKREHAPWNSHSKVPCPVPSEIQISRCPGLPNRQNLALDHRKTPDPGQNIARTFGVFYGRRVGPDASLASRAAASAARSAWRRSPCRSRSPTPWPRPAPEARAAPASRPEVAKQRLLAAIAVRCVVFSIQPHVAPCNDCGERLRAPGARLLGKNRLDPGKAHVAAILQVEAACIDHSADAALALRFERASDRPADAGPGRAAITTAHEWRCALFVSRSSPFDAVRMRTIAQLSPATHSFRLTEKRGKGSTCRCDRLAA